MLKSPSQICFNSNIIGADVYQDLKTPNAVVFRIRHEPEIQELALLHPSFGQVKISVGVRTAQLREKGKQTLVGRDLTCAGPPKAFTMHLGR